MNFWRDVWLSFKKINGLSASFIGIALAIITWTFAPTAQVSIKYLVPIAIIIVLFICSLITAYFLSDKEKYPKVLNSIVTNNKLLLLVEPSRLFSERTIVSIYAKEQDFEILVCIGIVDTIQAGGKIQIEILQFAEGQIEKCEKLQNANKHFLNSLTIKQTLPEIYVRSDLWKRSFQQEL